MVGSTVVPTMLSRKINAMQFCNITWQTYSTPATHLLHYNVQYLGSADFCPAEFIF